MRIKLFPVFSLLLLSSILSLWAQPEEWVVDQDRGPYQNFRYEAEEGTWISLDISPDGRTLVFDLLGHLYEMPVSGGEARALTRGRSWNQFPRYSPDGRKLLFTSDRGGSEDLWVITLDDGSLENISKMKLPVFQGSWSRDGRHLFATALNLKVRFPAFQFNLHGGRQELIPAGDRTPLNHFVHHPTQNVLYFEHSDQRLPASGPRIKKYDLERGEISVYIERAGGASNPQISPDGKLLAYVRRDDKDTQLAIRDLETHRDRVLRSDLDNGRFESSMFYGSYSNMAWDPSGREIFVSFGGRIHAVDAGTGATRLIPFRATLERKINETIRFPVELPAGRARTRSHRWAQRTAAGILFEALGDLYLKRGDELVNLTNSPDHETNPIFDSGFERVLYASWNDDQMGSLRMMPLAGGEPRVLVDRPTQYGSLALDPNGSRTAFVRGAGGLVTGEHLERQTAFELILFHPRAGETRLAELDWTSNRYAKRPPSVSFSPDGSAVFFTAFEDDVLTLKRVGVNGQDERVLYRFSNATRAVLSPDARWLAYREYHRTFVTPFDHAGREISISAADGKGFNLRVDPEDGDFTEWDEDSKGLHWTRGRYFYEKDLDDILSETGSARRTDLSFEFEVDIPDSSIVLKNVRVITMNDQMEVLENASVLIRNNRIESIGESVTEPSGARLLDLAGHTIIPGIFDAHGHYGSPISALNVIEQRLYGLQANLAYGVTTMYDVYGTTQKDFWVGDMLRVGAITGPRIFSVGDPLFVTKYRTKMYRPIENLEDAREHVRFNKDHGAPGVKDYSNHTRSARQQLAEASRQERVNLVTESFSNPFMNMTQLIDGFTGIEHTPGLTPLYADYIELFKATKAGMTPTLIVVYNGPAGERYFHQNERLWEDQKLLNFFRKDELIRLRRPTHYFEDDFYHREMAAELTKLYRAGVSLQMGAHGQMMGLGAHWEMELFVQGGFTPMEALQIATINGYRHQGLDAELGSIEAGKLADLVILQENPLEDIRNTRSVRYVIKNGVLYSGNDAAQIFPDGVPAGRLYFKEQPEMRVEPTGQQR